MNVNRKKIVGIFLLLSGLCTVVGCYKGKNSKQSPNETVIIAKGNDENNKIESYYQGTGEKEEKTDHINVNRLGYRKKDKKIAVVHNHEGENTFQVFSEEGKDVYTGKLEKGYKDNYYNEMLYYADFSSVEEEGTYYIMCGQDSSSPAFDISNDVYTQLKVMAEKPFSLKQSDEKEAFLYDTDKKIEISGGWYTNPHEGKCVVTSSVAIANLWNLNSIQKTKKGAKDKYGKQIKEEVRWLLKMQDKSTGGVYHKVSGRVSSEKDITLYVSPISTSATGDFAAIMAKASVEYAKEDEKLAKSCLTAAKSAWKYLEEHKENQIFSNPVGIRSKEYSDTSDVDERLWAATELALATGEQMYLDQMQQYLSVSMPIDFGWQNVSGFAYTDFYIRTSDRESLIYTEINRMLQQEVKISVDGLSKGFLINTTYVGEKNQYIMNRGVLLAMMKHADKDSKIDYTLAAKHFLDYILGLNHRSRNALSEMSDGKEEQTVDISSALLLILQNIG